MALKSLIILGAVLAVASGARSNFVQCVDTSLCPDGATCCETADGTWGCCPYEFGQCCQDGRHCCPLGYSCDAAQGSCVHELTQERLFRTALEPRVSGLAQNRRNEVIHGVNSVRCPDGNYCLDGQTCCLLTSGSFGCCPYQHAECCSDHTSCCPEGYRCRISTHQCVHATTNHTVAMAHKVSAVAAQPGQFEVSANDLFDENIRCPDGNYCEDGQTCCLLRSGQYGCCPYQYAQCCSDHVSCCPEGYLCKISTHQCIHTVTNHTVPMVQKVQPVRRPQGQASAPQVDAELNQCPDGSFCQDTQTCCLLKSGRYGCCPYAHAECCSDHTSCCPEGYRCLVSTQQCIHAESNGTAPMLRKVDSITLESTEQLRLKPDAVNNVRCPDGNYCLDGQTCCLLTSGSYGCCPYQHAECCSDHTSCCPEGYQCRISTHQCVHATTNHTMAMVQKVRAVATEPRQLEVSVNDTTESRTSALTSAQAELLKCPDGSYCQSTQTCCLLVSGHYGCCPYVQAQCCSDHTSCCPEGYRCKVSTKQCVHTTSNHSVAAGQKVDPVIPKSALVSPRPNDVTCPDGHKCQSGQTCCPLSSTRYGCCPLPDAVCCDDDQHCCPHGYICNEGSGSCEFGERSVPMVQKVAAFVDAALIQAAIRNEKCPDGNECDDDQTCCQLRSGSYGCCPYNHAVCCDDKVHCCPEGYKCDTQADRCINGNLTASPMSQIIQKRISRPANRIPVDVPNEKCPDGNKCDDNQTCCQLRSGSYGCCRYHHAVCCDDKVHCCPNGYMCNAKAERCTNGNLTAFPLSRIIQKRIRRPANRILVDVPNEKCPDGNKCDDEQTCCQLRSGSYGCCPYHHAVCCDDKVHCCPEGYKCDAKADRCINGNLTASPMSRIIQKRISRPANRILVDVPNEKCPDGNKCDDEQTCCQLRSGSYGCCPYHHAVCCDDKVHCCPEGYKCNAKAERCINGNLNASSMSRIIQKHISRPANRILVDEVKRTCSDGSTCPDFATCCKSPNNTYSCCPFSVATCCADGYCCPRGFVCDEARHMCTLRRRPEDLPYLN
ncbi:progranulin isoform X16 [Rhipicephalus microplus]|uniref:progranulin isoform X16 n=1 Tax=Rhipicephalus microplus TaxID=6941 RepID=UPI0018895C12|nr:progranulin-like isoform X14 [Rhipicephalus microplus]